MGKIPVTVTIDEDVFDEFKKLCLENDIKVSTKVNRLMKEWVRGTNNGVD